MIISEIDDENYIKYVLDDIYSYMNQYKHDLELCKDFINKYIDKSKELNLTTADITIPALVSGVSSLAFSDNNKKILAVGAGIAATASNCIMKEARKEDVETLLNNSLIDDNGTKPIEAICNSIDEYRLIRNSPIELVQTNNTIYIKCFIP